MNSILKILDEEEDVMFVIKLDMFSMGTIKIPIHTELVFKLVHIKDLSIT
jgi:hypothetical protein